VITGAPVRNRYLRQVERIASQQPLDRDSELAELALFCTDPRFAGTYRWWRAPAWSGKTTLLSWFVLHPPPGVRIVSFFITARLATQNDRSAFVNTVLEQLLAILGEPVPYLTDATRDGHMLGLLVDAANACRQRDEQFVLVVDGLDEDRGVVAGSGAHSIAALLPTHPPAGMRVIVAGRPNPPVPDDVPDNHPLRDASIVRVLSVSPRAQARERELKQDLRDLLAGTETERDLVGLLIASGGGLGAGDLCELTALSPQQVAARLDTVAGRVFDRRETRWRRTDGYLLGHEELHQAAVAELGSNRIARYRKRLHSWAEDYGRRGWPVGTPEYLLDGYVAMLTARGNLRRAVEHVTDTARHDRMLDVSGSDAAALAEVQAVARRLAERDDPDLAALGQVVVHRDHLLDRNSQIPSELLPVWAGLGHFDRVENLAGTLANASYPATYSDPQGNICAAIALAIAAGEHEHAYRLVDKAEELARGITVRGPEIGVSSHPWSTAWALARVVGAMEALGQHDRAEAVASTLFTEESKVMVLTHRAKDAIAAGEHERAHRLVVEAEELARTFGFNSSPEHPEQTRAWISVAEVMVALGQHDHAVDFVRGIPSGNQQDQVNALTELVKVLAATSAGDRARRLVADAEALIDAPDKPWDQAEVDSLDWRAQAESLAKLAEAAAVAGDHGRAIQLIADTKGRVGSITHTRSRVSILTGTARAAAAAGEPGLAGRLMTDIEALINDLDQPRERAESLARLAETAAVSGDWNRAESVALAITKPEWQASALARLAKCAIGQGEHVLARRLAIDAEAMARATARTGQRLAAPLSQLALTLADIGEFDRAQVLARTIRYAETTAHVLGAVAAAVFVAGHRDQARQLAAEAEAVIHTIRNPKDQVYALCQLARTLGAGDRELAGRLATDAETLADTITPPLDHPALARRAATRVMLARLTETWASIGDLDRAELLAHQVDGHGSGVSVRTTVATAAALAGDHHRVQRLVAEAEAAIHTVRDPESRAQALCELAEAIAKAGERVPANRLITNAETIFRANSRRDRGHPQPAVLAYALGAVGAFDRASSVVHAMHYSGFDVKVLSDLAQRAAGAGEAAHARRLAADAEASIPNGMLADDAKGDVTRAMLAAGERDQAEHIADSITNPLRRARALGNVIADAVAAGQLECAHRQVTTAHAVLSGIADPTERYQEMIGLLHQLKDGADQYHTTGVHRSDQLKAATALWARRMLAEIFLSPRWDESLPVVAFACPQTLTAIADEILVINAKGETRLGMTN
jgi:hypothetical protein